MKMTTPNKHETEPLDANPNEEEFNDEFLQDEKQHKPKGKKIKKMRTNFDRWGCTTMDDQKLLALATKLHHLTTGYINGSTKHAQYVAAYDKELEHHGITKQELAAALKKRRLAQ